MAMAEQETVLRAVLPSKMLTRVAVGVFALFVALGLYVLVAQDDSVGNALFLVALGAIISGMLWLGVKANENRRIRVTADRISVNGIDRFDVGFAEIDRVEAVKIRGTKGMCFWQFRFWSHGPRPKPIAQLDTRGFPPQELANTVLSRMALSGIILDASIEQWRLKPVHPCSRRRPHKPSVSSR